MRVLHLLHSLRRGGLERVVVSVANGLSRRGLTQGVCCLHQAGPLIEALAPEVCRETRRSPRPAQESGARGRR